MYSLNKMRIEKLKEWYGWGDDIIEMIKKEQEIAFVYRIMVKEKGG